VAWPGDKGRPAVTVDGGRDRGVTGSRDAVAASVRLSSTSFGRVNNRERHLIGKDGGRTPHGPGAAPPPPAATLPAAWTRQVPVNRNWHTQPAAEKRPRHEDAGQRR